MVTTTEAARKRIPRRLGDYTREAADERRAFIEQQTGARLEHVASYSFEPESTSGNVENFTGVGAVPIGLAVRCSSTASMRRASSTCR